MEKIRQPRFHRAWLVFAGMCLYYFVAYGLLYSGFGLFLGPMSEELGIPYVQLSTTAMVRVLSGMVTTAFIGKIFLKVRLRRFMSLVLLVLAGTILLVSCLNRMWQFIPVFAVMGLCCGLALYGIVPMILNQWFEAPAGLITIANVCGGAGGIILCPILSQVISNYGWRMGYRFMAVLVLVVMLPIAMTLLDLSPQSRGWEPLANQGKKSAALAQSALSLSGKPVPTVLYVLLALFFLIGALAGGMYIHISSALYSKGFAAVQVSLLVSCFQAGTTLLQFFGGMASIRWGLRPVTNVVLVITALGAVALILLTPQSPLLLVFAAVFLVGGGRIFTALNSLIVRYAFGQNGFSQTYPKLQAFYLVGTAFTSIIYGGIYSATGTYNGTFWLMVGCMAVLLVITQVIFILVDRVHPKGGN